MKRSLSTIFLFALFSCLIGCGGTQPNAVNNANAASNANANATVTTNYPPMSAGLAEAEFEQIDGAKFKLTEKKGKVVLVTLWGTWCGPCIAEMPVLIALQNEYRDKGFEIVGLNVGDGSGIPEPNGLVTKFAAEKKLNYILARSPLATKEVYKFTNADVVPQGLLIDREGRVRGAFIGGGPKITASMEDTVAKLMAE